MRRLLLLTFGALDVNAAGVLGSGPAAGALVIGSEDLGKVRGALGRIADEIHLILGILDQHLEATVPAPVLHPNEVPGLSEDLQLRAQQVEAARRAAAEVASRAAGVAGTVAALAAGDFVPMPRAPPSEEPIRPEPQEEVKMEGLRTALAWIWSCTTSLFWVGMFFLDIAIVIGMQIFLESIGQKRTGREIMSKKAMANALAKQATSGTPKGSPIPEPSASSSTTRLSVLSQEELLAAVLTEHWVKIIIGLGLAVAFRLPQCFLSEDGIVFHMFFTLAMVLRFMSPVMLWLRDDMTLPKKEKECLNNQRRRCRQWPPWRRRCRRARLLHLSHPEKVNETLEKSTHLRLIGLFCFRRADGSSNSAHLRCFKTVSTLQMCTAFGVM